MTSVRATTVPSGVEAYRAQPQFAVSLFKLAVMSTCTFGLYEVYWAYKHWRAVREREHEELSPFWRAVFAPYWFFKLFPRMQTTAGHYGVTATWSATGLALAYLALQLVWRLPAPWDLLNLLTVVPLMVVQRTVNLVNAAVAPHASRNSDFTGGDIVIVLVGGLLLFFTIAGPYLPADPAGP